jgi:hypothetical protein
MSDAAIGVPVGARAGAASATSDRIGVDDRRNAGPRNPSSIAIECPAKPAGRRSPEDDRNSAADTRHALRATTAE